MEGSIDIPQKEGQVSQVSLCAIRDIIACSLTLDAPLNFCAVALSYWRVLNCLIKHSEGSELFFHQRNATVLVGLVNSFLILI